MPRPSVRPKALTPELADAIYARLHQGQPIAAICEDPRFPSTTNFYRWLRADLAFRQTVAALQAAVPVQRRHPRRGPISYTPELAARVIARLSAGESQHAIHRDPSMPCTMTILKWARTYPAFAEARARALKAPRGPDRRRHRVTSPEVLEQVCLRLIRGESLESVCRRPGMPSSDSVYRHMRLNPGFAEDVRVARRMGRERRIDEALARRPLPF